MTLHVDTDFLIYALQAKGRERRRLLEVAESSHALCISSVACYEFARGPRTPEQLATARTLFADDGVIPFSETLAAASAETFCRLGSPRRRDAADEKRSGLSRYSGPRGRGRGIGNVRLRHFTGDYGLFMTDQW